ncbi:beta-ketoacyl-ACP synthase, partial [bacterium]|nr:beta-ketoacyl-ACP synthase [bacterium]
MQKRVAIVGMDIKSTLGLSVQEGFQRLHTYKNCVKYIEKLEEYKNLNSKLGAPIENFKEPNNFNRKIKRTMGRVSLLATSSAIDALNDANLLDDEIITNGSTGVSYGSSSGSIDTLVDFYAMCVEKEIKGLNSGSYIKMMPQTTAVNLSLYFKTTGRLITSSTACTSGSIGIGSAYETIKNGKQIIMIAGGAEEFHPTQIGVFNTLYAT